MTKTVEAIVLRRQLNRHNFTGRKSDVKEAMRTFGNMVIIDIFVVCLPTTRRAHKGRHGTSDRKRWDTVGQTGRYKHTRWQYRPWAKRRGKKKAKEGAHHGDERR